MAHNRLWAAVVGRVASAKRRLIPPIEFGDSIGQNPRKRVAAAATSQIKENSTGKTERPKERNENTHAKKKKKKKKSVERSGGAHTNREKRERERREREREEKR